MHLGLLLDTALHDTASSYNTGLIQSYVFKYIKLVDKNINVFFVSLSTIIKS